jgi:hypothetical protein
MCTPWVHGTCTHGDMSICTAVHIHRCIPGVQRYLNLGTSTHTTSSGVPVVQLYAGFKSKAGGTKFSTSRGTLLLGIPIITFHVTTSPKGIKGL